MRKSISIMLESDPEIEIIGTARDGEEGYNLTKTLHPDIVTMDIEMPKMDGITSLEKIMKDCPTPVLMISSLTTEGADATIKALEKGAVDFIPKELSFINVNIIKIKDELINKVKDIAKQKALKDRLLRLQRINKKIKGFTSPEISVNLPKIGYKAIALGISTGGPLSLQKVLPNFSKNINVPVFVVQHMPPKFTKSLAQRLDSMSELEIKEAEDQEPVRENVVYIAPGGYHMMVSRNGKGLNINISSFPDTTLHKPSVDIMMSSIINAYGKFTLGIIMTGMGKDGLEGVKLLKSLGGYCITQSAQSCVVYGMPKSIDDAGLSDLSVSLEQIPETINKLF